jgi:hypothetical protein
MCKKAQSPNILLYFSGGLLKLFVLFPCKDGCAYGCCAWVLVSVLLSPPAPPSAQPPAPYISVGAA